jgi:hypothetical protein
MLLSQRNRVVAAFLGASVFCITVSVDTLRGLARGQVGGAVSTAAQQESRPKATSPATDDAERRAQQAVQAAEAQLQAARNEYETIKAVRERAARERAASSQAALRRQIQTSTWFYLWDEGIFRADNAKQIEGGKKIKLLSVDPAHIDLLTLLPGLDDEGPGFTLELPLAKDVKVLGGLPARGGFPLRLVEVSVRLAENLPEVKEMTLKSVGSPPDVVLKALDPTKKTISLIIEGKVALEDLPIADPGITLKDWKPGMRARVALRVENDLVVVSQIRKAN